MIVTVPVYDSIRFTINTWIHNFESLFFCFTLGKAPKENKLDETANFRKLLFLTNVYERALVVAMAEERGKSARSLRWIEP